MMRKRYYTMIVVVLGLICLVDILFPDHHHAVFGWHKIGGFDAVYGFLGCLALIAVSLGLGKLFLWRDTFSVLLTEELVGSWTTKATVVEWLVEEGDTLEDDQPLVELETDRGILITALWPHTGKVATRFVDVGDQVRLGETLVNIRVSKKLAKELGDHGEENHA